MRLLIYPFYLLWTIISTNPIKSLFVTLISVLFYCAYFTSAYNDVTVSSKILASAKIENTYYYFYDKDSNGELKTIKSDKPMTFKDGNYVRKELSGAFCILAAIAWIMLVVFAIFIAVAFGQDDDDFLWEFGDCCEEAFNILVRCELEEGFYYYIALGRLVGKSQEPLRYYQADSFSSLLRCPRFKTKTQKRNEILNKLV